MQDTTQKIRHTAEEYLAIDRASDTKHEYIDIVDYGMLFASEMHLNVEFPPIVEEESPS